MADKGPWDMDESRDGIREWDIHLCWDVQSSIFTKSFPEVVSLLACLSFLLSGETVNSELPTLDVCDISTTDTGESFVLQEHIQSTFFWEADEQLGHFVDFLPQLLLAICWTLQQKQLERKMFPLFEENNQTKKDKVSWWRKL